MQNVRIEQKINISSLQTLKNRPKGHNTINMVAEIATEDETLVEVLKQSLFTLSLGDYCIDHFDTRHRIRSSFNDIVGGGVVLAYHIPKFDIKEGN